MKLTEYGFRAAGLKEDMDCKQRFVGGVVSSNSSAYCKFLLLAEIQPDTLT